jgi:hypothetical protein
MPTQNTNNELERNELESRERAAAIAASLEVVAREPRSTDRPRQPLDNLTVVR